MRGLLAGVLGVAAVALTMGGCSAVGERTSGAPSSSSASALERLERALVMPRATGKPDPVRYGVASGPFNDVIDQFLTGQRKPDVCLWSRTASGQFEAVTTGPVTTPAALGVWTDSARSVLVSETIVAVPDATASKLIAQSIAPRCRDRSLRLDGRAARLRMESDNVRTTDGRTERLTDYLLTTHAGTQPQQQVLIRVKGHVVFLALSPGGRLPGPDTYAALVTEAGTRAMTVLGRP
ncbi:hypothetical protein [Actinomadura fibrosa]|uniref:Sensor domain-containing protein n=1 Tax=Actinomadura fibrosa TaxID=111802 RepID=A0ABW2XVT9_9ACTN|nr:hypothetical protein [Actinomadura fibrosa]